MGWAGKNIMADGIHWVQLLHRISTNQCIKLIKDVVKTLPMLPTPKVDGAFFYDHFSWKYRLEEAEAWRPINGYGRLCLDHAGNLFSTTVDKENRLLVGGDKNRLFRTYTPESTGQTRRIGYKGIFGHIILKADVFIKGKQNKKIYSERIYVHIQDLLNADH